MLHSFALHTDINYSTRRASIVYFHSSTHHPIRSRAASKTCIICRIYKAKGLGTINIRSTQKYNCLHSMDSLCGIITIMSLSSLRFSLPTSWLYLSYSYIEPGVEQQNPPHLISIASVSCPSIHGYFPSVYLSIYIFMDTHASVITRQITITTATEAERRR